MTRRIENGGETLIHSKRYLVKLYIDQTGKLEKDFRAKLGDDEFVGQVEVESQWPVGYGRMTGVAFPRK